MVPNQTNVVYKCTWPFRECLTENNITANIFLGLTTTIFSRVPYVPPLLHNCHEQQLMSKHQKDMDKLKSPDKRNVLIKNTKIIHKYYNKISLQILEAIKYSLKYL